MSKDLNKVLIDTEEYLALKAVAEAAIEFQKITHWGMSETELLFSKDLDTAIAKLKEDIK